MKKIERIIFFVDTENGERKETAYILYSNNLELFVSKAEGIDYVKKLIIQENTSFDQLQDMGKISFMEEEKFDEFFHQKNKNIYDMFEKRDKKQKQKEINESQKLAKKENKKQNRNNTKEERKERNLKIRRSIYMFTFVSSIIAVCIFANKVRKSLGFFDEYVYYEQDSFKSNKKDASSNFSSLMTSDKVNPYKKLFIEKIHDYLLNYNKDYSGLHVDNYYNSRLFHSWDEIEVLEILYNNYNVDDIKTIFGTCNIKEDAYNCYLEEIKQERMAHIVQTTPLNKDNLINSDIGKGFYKKYENIIINFNNSSDKEEKILLAKKFYNNVEKDFKSNNLNENESYKLSVIPCIMAMNKLCAGLDKDFVMSDKDIRYYSSFCQKKISKVKNIIASNIDINDEEVIYDSIKAAAITDIENINDYSSNDISRNIGMHKEYKDRINWLEELKDISNKKQQKQTENKKDKEKNNKEKKEEKKSVETNDNKESLKDDYTEKNKIDSTEQKKEKTTIIDENIIEDNEDKSKDKKEEIKEEPIENSNDNDKKDVDSDDKEYKEKSTKDKEEKKDNKKIKEENNEIKEEKLDIYEDDINEEEYDSVITGFNDMNLETQDKVYIKKLV